MILQGFLWSFCKQTKIMFTFSVTHQNTVCIYLRSNKCLFKSESLSLFRKHLEIIYRSSSSSFLCHMCILGLYYKACSTYPGYIWLSGLTNPNNRNQAKGSHNAGNSPRFSQSSHEHAPIKYEIKFVPI